MSYYGLFKCLVKVYLATVRGVDLYNTGYTAQTAVLNCCLVWTLQTAVWRRQTAVQFDLFKLQFSMSHPDCSLRLLGVLLKPVVGFWVCLRSWGLMLLTSSVLVIGIEIKLDSSILIILLSTKSCAFFNDITGLLI